MRISHYTYNAFIVEDGDTKIAVDPGKNLRIGNMKSLIPASEWEGVSHIAVTHQDPDHYEEVIPMAKQTGAEVICGTGLGDELRSKIDRVHELAVTSTIEVKGVRFTGLKAKHGQLPIKLLGGLISMNYYVTEKDRGGKEAYIGPLRVMKTEEEMAVRDHGSIKLLFGLIRLEKDNVGFARGSIGFKIELGDKVLANLGDTLLLNDWTGLKPDILMIPIGGKAIQNTMDEGEALEAIRLIEPGIVIPCHYNSGFLFKRNINPADDQFFKREVESMGIECHLMGYGETIEF